MSCLMPRFRRWDWRVSVGVIRCILMVDYWLVLSFQRLYGYRSPTDPNCPYVLLLPVSATAIQL